MGLYGTLISLGLAGAVAIYGVIIEDEFYYTFPPIIIGMLVLLFFVIFLIAYSKRKKLLNRPDIDVVKSELMGDEVTVIDDIKVYITRNYIVSAGAYSTIIKLDDLALIYNEERSSVVNGVRVPLGLFLIAYLVNGKSVNIARSINSDQIHLLCDLLIQRRPNIMVGLTKENKAAIKEMKRNYKNNQV
jgi:hypothetical protein